MEQLNGTLTSSQDQTGITSIEQLTWISNLWLIEEKSYEQGFIEDKDW